MPKEVSQKHRQQFVALVNYSMILSTTVLKLLRLHLKNTGSVTAETENRSVVFHRFVGNCFHIYFLNSGLLYHYNVAIQDFFVRISLPGNAVQHSVLNALKLDVLHITTRALGVIGKVVTGPWMRLVARDLPILEMNPYFAEAHSKLRSWSEDASPLLGPSTPSVFANVPVKDDIVLDSLKKPTSSNDKTIALLRELCKACLGVVERQLTTQLEGGCFSNPSDTLVQQASSCRASNISCERSFGSADSIISRVPNATPDFVEARLMYKVNKSGKWLDSQDDQVKHVFTDKAISCARKNTQEEKVKSRQLECVQQENLRLSRE